MSHLRREILTLMPTQYFFRQFCDSNIDDNWTDIFIIPTRSCSERYARGRSGIICDTGILGDVILIARNPHTDAYILNANFSQFWVSNIDDSWTDISIIPAQSGGEWYARGRSGIICDTGTFGDVTFIARNRLTDAHILNAKFTEFCVSYIDDNWTDISIISTRSCSEGYARGRLCIIGDTGILGDVIFVARNRHTDAHMLKAIFFQFCVSYIDDNWTDIFIIPASSCGEGYARGRSGVFDDTGILGDVTFIARNRHTDAHILNAIFFPILR